jgi:hypothetical protein
VDELESVGQKDAIEKGAHAGRALALGTAEIRRIQGGGVGHRAVMLGVLTKGPKESRERLSEQPAKPRRDADRLESFCQAAFLTKADGFVQRDAEHCIIGFELLLVLVKNYFFSLRQPGVPVFLNRPSAG